MGSHISDSFYIRNGVRQGGILSPMLFNLYVDGLSRSLNSLNIGCKIGPRLVNHLAYADDLVLICPSVKGLQRLVDVCQEYGDCNDITYNCKKTVCMRILPKQLKLINNSEIKLYDKNLEFVDICKYLGFYMNRSFCDDGDINRQMRSFYIRSNYLIRNFSKCSDNVKSLLFNSYCSSMYCAPLWSNFKLGTIRKLTVSYNNVFRRLMSLPRRCSASSMFVFNPVSSFGELWRKLIYSFRRKILTTKNMIMIDIVNTTQLTSDIFQNWNSTLYC